MRADLRPYQVKKVYLQLRKWYANYFLRPRCKRLGDYHTIMKPWYVNVSGPNIEIGNCWTAIGERDSPVNVAVWGREAGAGRITIGDNVLCSPGTRISASDEICIGDAVMMANGVYITDSDWHTLYDRTSRSSEPTPVHIGDNVWLGDGATVLKGVTIGENSVVAARAVVVKNVPANVVVAGNPARVVKQLDPQREFVTRNEFFADPQGSEDFFDAVDKQVLGKNSYFHWIRSILFPSKLD
ncbi:MAG: acetyltransferase-like isoleucine patch superfamily enzyme [Halieaceae bacterium]|jgi:acetyltransferase-like isoleucine patch superfamily enzyme